MSLPSPRRLVLALFLSTLVGFGTACSSSTTSEPAEANLPIPSDSKLAKVTLDMTDAEVRGVMGEPDNSNEYMTGKAWIPFYYGPDTHRSDWMYYGEGRVVFSRNRWSGGLKVIDVIYHPNEAAM